jgi:hypothetical protein
MPFATLTRAAGKFARSVARRAGVGAVHPHWTLRAEICERCPVRMVVGRVSYCGKPLHHKPIRDQAEDGCGCPTRENAKDPEEHCPLTPRHLPASGGDPCDCKWCTLCKAPHAR